MGNILVNGGFETDSDWTLGPSSTFADIITTADGNELSGSGYLKIRVARDPPPLGSFVGGQAAQTISGVTVGTDLRFILWVDTTTDGSQMLVEAAANFPGSGFTTLGTIDATTVGRGYTRHVFSFTATGSTVAVRLSGNAAAEVTGNFYIDDASLIEVAITKTIKDAIINDLDDITVANGFASTVAEVGSEPKRIDEAQFPGLYLAPDSGGTDEEDTFGCRTALGVQRYAVQMFVQSSTPNADMDALLDDVRNAIERGTGNAQSATGVQSARVAEWTETTTEEHIHGEIYYREAVIEVQYYYTLGSA